MGIEVSERKNGEQLIEYKIPNFYNESGNNFGSNSDDYEILQVLGGGGFSKVLKVKSKADFGIYAMKKVDMANIIQKEKLSPKYFENEVLFLKKLNHPNIIKCYNIFQENQYLYFIMEFMNNGDLESYNKGIIKMNLKIPEEKLWEIFYKCLSGLDYIHKQNIIHRDIKLQNLFLDDNFNVKIGDFNISAVTDQNAAKKFAENANQIDNLLNTNTILGTPNYQAPEIDNENYGQKVDIYSMGISFFELCYGFNPNQVKKGKGDDSIYSKEIKDFIKRMINLDEKKRPTCNEAMTYAKNFFIKLYVKNTSVEASFNCFSSFPNINQYFSDNYIANAIFELKREIACLCISVIQSMKSNNISQIKLDMYELRKSLEKEGLDIKSDNKEIDPGNFIIFFIRKLNDELNEIIESNNKIPDKEKVRRFKILNKRYSFPQNEVEKSFQLIINTYNLKILSFISRNFFSFIKAKRTCSNCKQSSCSFDKLYFIPINIDILKQKCGNFGNLSLKNAINSLNHSSTNIDIKKGIECNYCKKISQFIEFKNFYHTAKNLIIIFDRGENFEHTSFIDFDDNLTLNNTEVERYNEIHYQLTGIIAKIKEEYISFVRQNNIWISSKGEQFNFISVKKYGTIVALFYYSDDNFLILESTDNKIQTNMQNQQSIMNNNIPNNNNQSPLMINNMNNNLQNNFNQMNNNQNFLNMDDTVNILQKLYNNIQLNNNMQNNNFNNNYPNNNNIQNLNNNMNQFNNFPKSNQNSNQIFQNQNINNNIYPANNNFNNNIYPANNNFNNNIQQNSPIFNQNNQIPPNLINTKMILNGNNNINNFNNMPENNFINNNMNFKQNQFGNFMGNNNQIMNNNQGFNNFGYK